MYLCFISQAAHSYIAPFELTWISEAVVLSAYTHKNALASESAPVTLLTAPVGQKPTIGTDKLTEQTPQNQVSLLATKQPNQYVHHLPFSRNAFS